MPLVVAHRGASAAAPEHTRYAYDAAVEAGADSIEVDVQLTADGVPVCLHDASLHRVAGTDDAIGDLTLAQLRELDLGSWFNRAHPDLADDRFSGARVVTLSEQLDAAAEAGIGLHIELKDPSDHGRAMTDALIGVLAERDRLDDPTVVVESFDVDGLALLGVAAPTLRLGVLWFEARDELVTARLPGWAAVSGPNVFAVLVHPGHVTAAHARDLEVHVWTADEDDEVDALVELGVDAIVTNRPAEVRARLDASGDASGTASGGG